MGNIVGEVASEFVGGYYLKRETDVIVLRRVDGTLVAPSRGRAGREIWPGERPAGLRGSAPVSPTLGLRANFLGRFELLRDGEAVSLGRNARALSILKYLLVRRSADRPVPQDYLMGWLWPDSDPKRARWSLNSAIYALRKLLGGCLPSLPASGTVLFERGGYRLSPRVRLSADVGEFDARYEEGRGLEEAGRAAEAIGEYEKAVGLYRGEYLVEDLYEEWTLIERERLAGSYVDMLNKLALHYTETGRLRESVRTCYLLLEKDNCHEGSYRLLMECFVRLGLWDRALHQYRLCEQILNRKYNAAPSSETRALHRNLLEGKCVSP